MSQESQQAITHVLQQDSKVLDNLLYKLNELQKLNKILSECLEGKLVGNCHIGSWENGKVQVVTHNAIWATQFRFQLPQIQAKLKQFSEFEALKLLQCKIVPNETHKTAEPERTLAKLSPHTAAIVKDMAGTIQHSPLRAVMERIAKYKK